MMAGRPGGRGALIRPTAAAGLLGAACVAWAAEPVRAVGRGGPALVVLAACCVALGTVRLAATGLPFPDAAYGSVVVQGRESAVAAVRRAPWAEGTVLGTLALEALHPARPWHTGLLGAALVAYLLATHLAESATSRSGWRSVLRGQLPVLAAGLGLLTLAVGAAMLPVAGPGPGADWLRVIAAIAAVAVGALALPV